jgi:hypothetical protein
VVATHRPGCNAERTVGHTCKPLPTHFSAGNSLLNGLAADGDAASFYFGIRIK